MACLVLLLLAAPGGAVEVKIFKMQTQSAFLAGTLEGVSVDALGRMQLADRAERLTAIQEPFLLAAAPHPQGWVVGTGNAGKVLQIDRQGRVTVLFSAPEPEVFAVWADPDGAVFAGTSPRGKVYRIAGGEGQEYFDPGEIYIWGLARGADGALLVATGTQGRLYRVGAAGQGEVLFDSEDTHLRSLKVLPGGDVLLGTAGEGLILRLSKDGQVRTLYDAAEPEIVTLATAPDGTCFAAAVSSEASFIDLTRPPATTSPASRPQEAEEEPPEEGEPKITVVVQEELGEAVGTRRRGIRGPRSRILRISPAGVAETLWTFQQETVYSLLWHRNRLWVGTGLEGKLFSYQGDQMVLEKDVDERQVVAVIPDQPGPAFATTNAAAFYRFASGTERQGTYTSPALDAGEIAQFGAFRWRGEAPRGAEIQFSFRSGVSGEPDRTWSPWTAATRGREILLGDVPRGRYIQWRADLRAGDTRSPLLYGVELSYRQENLTPQIRSLEVLDPGQILVPANFNPATQVFEPTSPSREGIFTTLKPSDADDSRRFKTLWKWGFRSLRWQVEDPNGDKLIYEVSFRQADDDGDWLPVVQDLEESHYSFDATVLPDGVYRFRLVASDRPSNQPAEALTAEQVSEPVVIDHTPPTLAGARHQSPTLRVTVKDEWTPLREAVYSLDAGEWRPARPVDGLLDGQEETFEIQVPEGARLVLLRVVDAAFNVVTFDLLKEAR